MVRTFHSSGVLIACAALVLSACSGSSETADNASAGSQSNTSTQTPPKPRTQTVSVPGGTTLVVALDEQLRTDTHKSGDGFSAHTVDAIVVNNATVFPAGSKVRGRLVHVDEPHRTAGKAEMTLAFDEIVDRSGKSHSISASQIVLEGKGDKISDEEKVAGGAVIGGIIGALTSKDKAKGAATGAVAGGAAGGAIALATKGQQLELPVGQRFTVELTSPVQVQIASN